ncbi:MAG: fumarylacetoacetase [Phycisphaerae bacterium]|nr:fumarylacetoacetase [Phycisphaerae bacterium]
MTTTALDRSHDSARRSWVDSANDPASDFPIQNLPWGVFRDDEGGHRIGVAIGDRILDVQAAVLEHRLDGLSGVIDCALCSSTLNQFMSLGHESWSAVRHAIADLLDSESEPCESLLRPMEGTEMLLPADIGDYTDFYASRHHATNVGRMFRPDGDPLLPNYLHLPVGYHGRASSIVVSGTPIRRPHGQLKPNDGPPEFRPISLLDYELEFGAFIGQGNEMGTRVPMGDAMRRLFGVVILNDWSARDVQKWEYQPLGPFNAKNFASSISPWIVTLDALAPFRSHGPSRREDDPALLDYLNPVTEDVLDITCEVHLASESMRRSGQDPIRLTRGSLSDISWSFAQMLSHHTSTGCPMRAGDLIGSGTVSGTEKDSRGCLLELTWRGSEPVELPDGTQRKFLLDGDELTIIAYCESDGARRIGLGSCSGIVTPAS